MGDVFRLYIPGWPVCRATLALGAYLGLVFAWSVMACVTPAQALAAVEGRGWALPDDVKRLAPKGFGHRVMVAARSGLVSRRQSAGAALQSRRAFQASEAWPTASQWQELDLRGAAGRPPMIRRRRCYPR